MGGVHVGVARSLYIYTHTYTSKGSPSVARAQHEHRFVVPTKILSIFNASPMDSGNILEEWGLKIQIINQQKYEQTKQRNVKKDSF